MTTSRPRRLPAHPFPRRPPVRRGALVVLSLAVCAGLDGRAQSPLSPLAQLDLGDVVRTTMQANVDVQVARQQAEIARGVRIESAAPFDTLLQADSSAARIRTLDPIDGVARQVSNSVSLRRLFRNGLSVTTDAQLLYSGHSLTPADRTPNDLTSTLGMTAPLLRDRGGRVSAANERAATRDLQSSLWSERQAVAARVLSSVAAYWEYLATAQQLQVFREAEERAQHSVDQTRALVTADERTQADLTQILGNLSAKRVLRIAAEQSVVEAWQVLVLAMGLPPDAVLTRPSPATRFPALAPAAGAVPEASQGTAERRSTAQLLSEAYARRPDLVAAEETLRADEILQEASRSALQPRLDLGVATGYKSRAFGRGFGTYLFDPFGTGSANNLDASLQLFYEFPVANSAARGRLLQTSSVTQRQRVLRDDLRRQIAAGVATAAEALVRGELGMRESEEAVRLLDSTVQAEQRKFQFGMSTLFDVIQAQDALTNSLLGRIESQRNYAVAVASLRYQSGTLLQDAATPAGSQVPAGSPLPPVVVPVQALLTPP